jgi:hypothetical protein
VTRQEALRRVSTGAVSVVDWFRRVPVRAQLKAKDRQEAKEQEQAQPALFILQERQQDVLDFYNHFENLVEVLCDAAQRGATGKLQARYTEERNWMQTHYYLVRPYLAAYLTLDADDAEHSLLLDGVAGDAVQTLYASGSLDSMVHSDDGNMISRIIRCREAQNLYAEHLRQLIAREKACS